MKRTDKLLDTVMNTLFVLTAILMVYAACVTMPLKTETVTQALTYTVANRAPALAK